MKKDTDITKVIFRMFTNEYSKDEVIALFPELPGDSNIYTCLSYMHIGQHSSVDIEDNIDVTKPATPEQYAPLFEELESIGYNLKVCKRYSPKMCRDRITAYLIPHNAYDEED